MKTIYINSKDRADVNSVLKNISIDVSQYVSIVNSLPEQILSSLSISPYHPLPIKEALLQHSKHDRKKVLAFLYLKCVMFGRSDLLPKFVRDL